MPRNEPKVSLLPTGAHWPALKKLSLEQCRVGDSGAAALASGRWPSLQELILRDRDVGDEGAKALAAAQWPTLVRLCLSRHNAIGWSGAEALRGAVAPSMRGAGLRIAAEIELKRKHEQILRCYLMSQWNGGDRGWI